MNTTTGSTTVLEASIDWVTATITPGTKQLLASAMALRWIEARQREGFQRKDWTFLGYLGERTDGVSLGSRVDGTIIRLSGDLAHRHGGQLLRMASNVSRLDLEVTIQHDPPNHDWASEADYVASQDARCLAGLTRRQLLQTSPGGTTFYLGSRNSERFFRIYDKTAESEGLYPACSWRWEIEYKGSRAEMVSRHIRNVDTTANDIRAVVETAFKDYDIRLPCDPLPKGWRDAGIRGESDDQRRLAWLERSIGPMVSKLLETTDPDTVLTALGLEAYLDVVQATTSAEEAP